MELTETGKATLRSALGNANDNLARMKLQLRADPSWRSGNGVSIQDMIADCEETVRALEADVASHG